MSFFGNILKPFKTFFRVFIGLGTQRVKEEAHKRIDHTDKLPDELKEDLKTATDEAVDEVVEEAIAEVDKEDENG
ncbi:MAG: hypothetical protein ACE5KG_05130 [Nitrososphaerales archaeon]